MQYLKADTAATVTLGPFVDDTDGVTAETSLTISQADVRISKAGGNIAQKNDATACTHDELGYYSCPLDATDTNTEGRISIFVSESGALPVRHDFMVLAAQVYDSLVAGTDNLQIDLTQINGVAASTAGSVDVSTTSVNAIADQVLDEALSGHTTAGTLGKAVADIETDATAILEDTATTLPATLATIDGIVDDILLDTAAIPSASAISTQVQSDLATEIGRIDAAVSSRAVAGDAMALTTGERTSTATAILDLSNGIETGITLREAMRYMASALVGQAAGLDGTTVTFRAIDNSGTTRITATVDADGNRSSVTLG